MTKTKKPVVPIDGQIGAGAGHVLRGALLLSVLTGTPFEMYDIGSVDEGPGLQPQHMACVEAAKAICGAEVEGASVGATEFFFQPGEIRPGDYWFGIGTGAPATHLLQTILIPLTRPDRASTVTVVGGTHVPGSPSFHWMADVWCYFMARIGFHFEPKLVRAGYHEGGGGEMQVRVRPIRRLKPLMLVSRGRLRQIRGVSVTSNLPDHVAERQADAMREMLGQWEYPCDVTMERAESSAEGTQALLVAEFERTRAGYAALGRRGQRAEETGREVTKELLAFLEGDGVVDEHLADQILLPLALVRGKSAVKPAFITRNLKANIELLREFVPEARVSPVGEGGSIKTVEITGGGLL